VIGKGGELKGGEAKSQKTMKGDTGGEWVHETEKGTGLWGN